MADKDLIACNEEHEMKYVLKKYEKSQSNDNVAAMQQACKDYKADDAYKPHNRDNFYKYIEEKGVLDKLQ